MLDLKIGMNRGRLLNSNLLKNKGDKLKVLSSSLNTRSFHTKVDKPNKIAFKYKSFFA
jgi:hypothetical protein